MSYQESEKYVVKMQKNNIVIILLMFLFMTSTYAGNEVGNGGLGFWCPQSKTYQLLDFYEHNLLSPGNPIIKSDHDYIKIIKDRLQLLSKLDAKHSAYYERMVNQVTAKINFLDNIKLNSTKDSFELAHPKDCELKQWAVQKIALNGNDTEYFFDKGIWNSLDNISKAGLVMHEIIYDHFINLDEKNSIKVRKFNSFMFSQKFEKTNTNEYHKFIKDLKIPLY